MACERTELSAYLDGELTDAERRRVEAHLEGCPACAAELRSLERTKAMLTAYAIPSGLHARLMTRIEGEGRRRHRGMNWAWAGGLAAAAALVLTAAFLYSNPGPPETPGVPAVAPLVLNPEHDETPAPLEVVAQAPAPETGPETPALAVTDLALELRGTAQGALPQATVVRTDTGKSDTYDVGEEVRPGVRLAEVREREVVLTTDDGQRLTLAMSEGEAPNSGSIAGMWEATLSEEGGKPETLLAKIAEENGLVQVEFFRDAERERPEFTVEGRRRGQRLMLAQVLDDIRLDIQGTLNEALNEFDGQVVAIEPQGNHNNGTLAMKRIPEEVLRAQAEAAKADEERRAELQALYEPLKQYAEAHGGAFPPALKALVPVPLANLDLYSDREDRRVQYMTARSLRPWDEVPSLTIPAIDASRPEEVDPQVFPIGQLKDYRTDLSMGERLVAYEEDLRRAWGSEVPSVPVLKVDYKAPDQTYYVLIGGNVMTPPGDEPIPDEVPAGEREAFEVGRDRAMSQNNLKQFMVVLKMFANENKGHLPGGWLTVYPEYMTDPSMCTAPWDPPFTNSYELLYPGATEQELETLGTQAEVPAIIEKRANPKEIDPPGRNVAFLDGHVEFVEDGEWEAQVGRFLR